MNKFSNKRQLHMLFMQMQRNPDMAKGRTKENKERFDTYWMQLSSELNVAGPPTKSMYEWKKVWIDQKRYMRRKAAANACMTKEAGNREQQTELCVSSSEEIMLMSRGLLNAGTEEMSTQAVRQLKFGAASNQTSNENAVDTPVLIPKVEHDEYATDISSTVIKEEQQFTEQSLENSSNNNDSDDNVIAPSAALEPETVVDLRSNKRRRTALDFAEEELLIQNKIYHTIDKAVKSCTKHNKALKIFMKSIQQKLSRLEDHHKLKLQELKRHNAEMEQLRRREVESKIKKNSRLVEIEEMKLKLAGNQIKI